MSGLVVERLGHMAGFLSVTMVSVIAIAILWVFLPETRPLKPPSTRTQSSMTDNQLA
jgi:predicted MFS family arabinose efflux permease